ncbi:hypothetical protein [Methylobacterium sp. WL64]|nr:hypothetical protein [Methylobacterium sp. WL64]
MFYGMAWRKNGLYCRQKPLIIFKESNPILQWQQLVSRYPNRGING